MEPRHKIGAERRSACANASRQAQVEEELALPIRDRMTLALVLGIESQAIFDPEALRADLDPSEASRR